MADPINPPSTPLDTTGAKDYSRPLNAIFGGDNSIQEDPIYYAKGSLGNVFSQNIVLPPSVLPPSNEQKNLYIFLAIALGILWLLRT